MEDARVVPSVFLVFDGFALVAEGLRVVDVKECSACSDWCDVVYVCAFVVASSAVWFEFESETADVVPFGAMLASGSCMCGLVLPWFALVLCASALVDCFVFASCEGASCLWSCRHVGQSTIWMPSLVRACRYSPS